MGCLDIIGTGIFRSVELYHTLAEAVLFFDLSIIPGRKPLVCISLFFLLSVNGFRSQDIINIWEIILRRIKIAFVTEENLRISGSEGSQARISSKACRPVLSDRE
jgi:hypothetical protein